MATIDQIVAQIRTAIYGKDVRENIAQGIEKCYEDSTANAQIQAIINKGQETLDSIPEDYTALTGEVDDLKSAIDYINGSYIDPEEINKTDGTTFTFDDSTGAITVTVTGSGNYPFVRTDSILDTRLTPGNTYRLHAKAEIISGTPSQIQIGIRGRQDSTTGLYVRKKIEDGVPGYLDFVATEYNKQVVLYAGYSGPSTGAVIRFSEIWLKRVETIAVDDDARNAVSVSSDIRCMIDTAYQNVHFENAIGGLYFKFGTLYLTTPFGNTITVAFSTIEDALVTSPDGVSNCAYIAHNKYLVYDISNEKLVIKSSYDAEKEIVIFAVSTVWGHYNGAYDGIVGGVGQIIYCNWFLEQQKDKNARHNLEMDYGNSKNLLNNITMVGREESGITYKFNRDGSVTLNGTSSAKSIVRYYYSTSELPSYIKKREKYYLYYEATDNRIVFEAQVYAGGSWQGDTKTAGKYNELYIPDNATGLHISMAVPSGVTLNNQTLLPFLFSALPNVVIEENIQSHITDTATVDTNMNNIYFEPSQGNMLVKFNTMYISYKGKSYTVSLSTVEDERETSPSGVSNCVTIPHNYALVYDTLSSALVVKARNQIDAKKDIAIFIVSAAGSYPTSGSVDTIIGGIGVPLYWNWIYATKIREIRPYWVEHLANKIADIQLMDANHPVGDSFVFITDTHWPSNAKQSPSLINEVLKKTSVSKVFHCGDLINYNSTKEEALAIINDYYSYFNQAIPIYTACGNHEDNGEQAGAGTAEHLYPKNRYGAVTRKCPNNIETEGKTYFVLKNEQDNIAYIFLDSCDYSYDNDQLAWLSTQLNTLSENYYVVIITHMYYTGTEQDERYEPTAGALDNALSALSSEKLSKVIGIITGHTHRDGLHRSPTGVPVIVTTCDAYQRSDAVSGTITEQAFDVVHIDLENETIYLTRIGSGNDRSITFRET